MVCLQGIGCSAEALLLSTWSRALALVQKEACKSQTQAVAMSRRLDHESLKYEAHCDEETGRLPCSWYREDLSSADILTGGRRGLCSSSPVLRVHRVSIRHKPHLCGCVHLDINLPFHGFSKSRSTSDTYSLRVICRELWTGRRNGCQQHNSSS